MKNDHVIDRVHGHDEDGNTEIDKLNLRNLRDLKDYIFYRVEKSISIQYSNPQAESIVSHAV